MIHTRDESLGYSEGGDAFRTGYIEKWAFWHGEVEENNGGNHKLKRLQRRACVRPCIVVAWVWARV